MLQIVSIIIIVFLMFQIVKGYKLSMPYEGKLISEEYDLSGIVDEDFFWKEIEISYSDNYQKQIENLRNSLTDRSKDELVKFRNTFDLLMIHSYDSNLWEKAYAINMGCSDDSFEYFRSWVIAQGKERFYHSIHDPNFLKYFAKKELFQNYEGIQYVADEIAELKGYVLARNSELPEYQLKGNADIESGVFKNLFMMIVTLFN